MAHSPLIRIAPRRSMAALRPAGLPSAETDLSLSSNDHPAAPRPAKRGDRLQRARVRTELDLVLASPDFDASPRSHEFLRFIVEETLAGRRSALTQAEIACRVFGRREDFDAVIDPIVRIQAGRLRRSLERYYLLAGANDPIRIELPRGAYGPVFAIHAERALLPELGPASSLAADWPSVGVSPFEPPRSGAEQQESTACLNEALVREMGHYADVRTMLEGGTDRLGVPGRDPARFVLDGRQREEGGALRVSVRLLDRATGVQLWGDEFHTAAQSPRRSACLEDIGRAIAARVASEEGVIVRLLADERRKGGAAVPASYRAILLGYDFWLRRDPASLLTALEALRQAVEAEPDCSLAWTVLARLGVTNHVFEVAPLPTPVDEALAHAQCGVRQDPACRRARAVLATALLVKGELAAARHELDEALGLSPDSLVYREVLGQLLALLGDERGADLIRSTQERNPHCLPYGSFGLWFDHVRRGEWEAAYQEALGYRDPSFFWRAVMRASSLARLGRLPEARESVHEILQAKPDFALRGRELIGRLIKLPEVLDQVVDGLARAGLKLGRLKLA